MADWYSFAAYLTETYDTWGSFEDEDLCVECPECREPIYYDDYPSIEKDGQGYVCPVCESAL